MYDALNKGIKIAKGDYIEIIGADDCFCDKYTIEKIVKKISAKTDILSCQEWGVTEYGRQYILSNHHAIQQDKYSGGMIPHGGMFVKSSIYKDMLFDTKYKIAADYKFFLKCYFDKEINITYVDDLVLFFSVSGVSSDVEKCNVENKQIYKELNLQLKAEPNIPLWKEKINNLLMRIGVYNLFKKHWCKAKYLIYNFFVYKKHKCDNELCRWCDRYGA